jgi:mannan endo-1,4-beta-mannosidase
MRTIFQMRLFLVTVAMTAFLQAMAGEPFVTVKNGRFMLGQQTYRYIGVNYWYGGLEARSSKGKQRIKEEVAFLAAKGVRNIRVLAGAEGAGPINGVPRVEPALQTAPGIFNVQLLEGLDFLLAELARKKMKAIIYFSNNWEWSGGFLQYLNWNRKIADSVLKRKLSWDEMRDLASGFYNCDDCISQYNTQLKLLVERTNSITKKKYRDDPAIMAWEIANEPRPMRPVAIEAYKKFIHETAVLIRSLDPNHLVTTGAEGDIGTENMDVFRSTHEDKYIDYLTIHIWPKNWGWFSDTAIGRSFDQVLEKTGAYIKRHTEVAVALKKPLVIEEFGLPRDQHSFSLQSSTIYRDRYYAFVFDYLLNPEKNAGVIYGANCWAFAGKGRPSHRQLLWVKGDDVLGDPPVEEQGLNSVFDADKSTWNVITSCIKQLNRLK